MWEIRIKKNKKTAHIFRIWIRERAINSQLPRSYLVAHNSICLVLLRSSPDTVHSESLHKTPKSTSLVDLSLPYTYPRYAVYLAVADCKLQGTASSPYSAVFLLYINFKNNASHLLIIGKYSIV